VRVAARIMRRARRGRYGFRLGFAFGGDFRLGFAFRGYTPHGFAKSVQATEKKRLA
jgi:hypothetical protein